MLYTLFPNKDIILNRLQTIEFIKNEKDQKFINIIDALGNGFAGQRLSLSLIKDGVRVILANDVKEIITDEQKDRVIQALNDLALRHLIS